MTPRAIYTALALAVVASGAITLEPATAEARQGIVQRIKQGVTKVNRTRWLPHSVSVKEDFIGGAIFSGALYGCEASHVNESEICKFSTGTARALGHSASARASTELFFNSLINFCKIFKKKKMFERLGAQRDVFSWGNYFR